MLNLIDEFTRECLAIRIDQRLRSPEVGSWPASPTGAASPAMPAVAPIGELRGADRPNRIGNRLALRYQHIDLTQLRDNLLGLVLLLGHSWFLHLARKPTSGRTTLQGAGHSALRLVRPEHLLPLVNLFEEIC